MSARRAPADPPASVRRDLRRAQEEGATVVFRAVSIMPPSGKRGTWRVKGTTGGRSVELSGGRTLETAWAAYIEVRARMDGLEAPVRDEPRNAGKSVNDLLDAYFTNKGADANWKPRTTADRRRDFKDLRAIAGHVACRDLTDDHVAAYIQSAAGTHGRAASLRNVTSTLLEFGRRRKYLTETQTHFAKDAPWPAEGVEVDRMPIRRDQAQAGGGGNVPTHDQVTAFADACRRRYAYGDGLVHAAANLGLRSGELRLLTADPATAMTCGNLVDTAIWEVRVRFQVGGPAAKGRDYAKGGTQRQVVVPPTSAIKSGFDLRGWLTLRCAAALAEQAAGTNPRALLFPTKTGRVWDDSNLREDVWLGAANDLGWRMEEYRTLRGRSRALYRFTLHSLRDRYATTAINEWLYTEEQLLAQGSWKDAETVRRYYSGTTDDTHLSVRSLHGL